jgi:NADH dehydrogenase FAD-containing subunit
MARIVIVGGGPAGIAVAQTLAGELTSADGVEIVVLEKSKYYFHAVGAPRAFVEPAFTNKLFVPYDKVFPASAKGFAKVTPALVTRIVPGANEVEYAAVGEDGDTLAGPVKSLAYDYLVLATGSTYAAPVKPAKNNFKRSATEAKFTQVREQIKKSSSILIVGGGPVGIEIAGEIKAKYPKKTVTILDANTKLVSGADVRDKFRAKLDRYLKRLDIKVVTGERLESPLAGHTFETRTLRTDKGTELTSDLQLLCAGFSPAADLVQKLDASLLTSKGAIKVNDKFQLDSPAYDNIYALGDASNSPVPKMAYWAGQQGKHLGAELARVARKTQGNVSTPFPKPTVGMLVVPLGPNGGVSQLPVLGGLVGGNLITRNIKSKEYFVSQTWSSLGAVAPAK